MSPFRGISLVFLNVYLLLSVNSETVQEDEDTDHSVKCDAVECQKLRNHVEILEAAVRDIALALTSEKKGHFSSINKILERSLALRTIVSYKPTERWTLSVPQPNTSNTLDVTDPGEKKSNATLLLKGSLKCSLANLLDINTSEIRTNTSETIEASVVGIDSLEIKWSIPYDCVKFSHGVWIRVTESEKGHDSPDSKHLAVPQKCLKKQTKSLFSIVLSSPTNTTTKEETCYFELKHRLIPCRSHIVEVIPNFHSLKGRTMISKVIIQPTKDDKPTTNMESLINVSYQRYRSDMLTLSWKDISGCSPQLTSFNLKIALDAETYNNDETNLASHMIIPRSCLHQSTSESNLYSVTLYSDNMMCPFTWKTLNECRKYKLEMKPQYSDMWTGTTSYWEIFTGQKGRLSEELIERYLWMCEKNKYFYCERNDDSYYDDTCADLHYICNDEIDCWNGIDELNCDNQCRGGLRCGRQCVSRSKICDGNFDCLDGSDEPYECDNTTLMSCNHLNANYGRVSSQFTLLDKEYIHSSQNPVQKSAVLITVQRNHSIWLAFNKFHTEENHFLRVYDGPYLTSPLIMEHSGSTKPLSARSSSNNVYVVYPSYSKEEFGIDLFYTSMENINTHATAGCGGYIYGEGVIFISSDVTSTNATDCIWYVETRQSNVTILLKKDAFIARVLSFEGDDDFSITVFDGWSTSGPKLHSAKATSISDSAIYSITNKLLVQITSPKLPVRNKMPDFYWNVTSDISSVGCQENLINLGTGAIKTPKYPAAYPHFSDCRWYIKTTPNSTIRVLFAFFETQEGFDYVFVYDGPIMSSPLLLKKSGLLEIPFTINSSSNELLVRFTSDDHTSAPGFLAIYSTISY